MWRLWSPSHVDEQDGIPAHDIPATLTMPVSATADAKVPAVVMLHGTGSNRDEAGMGYAMAAPRMAADGIATLRIDFMGNGDSTASYTDYNYTSAIIDAKAAADYLAGLETVDADNLGVMGWSQGGTDALPGRRGPPRHLQGRGDLGRRPGAERRFPVRWHLLCRGPG